MCYLKFFVLCLYINILNIDFNLDIKNRGMVNIFKDLFS